MNQVSDDMDRAIAFHMDAHNQPKEPVRGMLREAARHEQEAIEERVESFVERARAIDHLASIQDFVASLERQVVVLQEVVIKLQAPIQRAEQDLVARRALHAQLQQELQHLNHKLRKKIDLVYNPGGRRGGK